MKAFLTSEAKECIIKAFIEFVILYGEISLKSLRFLISMFYLLLNTKIKQLATRMHCMYVVYLPYLR